MTVSLYIFPNSLWELIRRDRQCLVNVAYIYIYICILRGQNIERIVQYLFLIQLKYVWNLDFISLLIKLISRLKEKINLIHIEMNSKATLKA